MARVKLKPLTLREAELIKDDSRLFVLNRANPEGNINLNVTSDGQRIAVVIPMTFVPIDMSNFAQRQALLGNTDFRKLIAKGAVQLVDNDEAEALVTTDKRCIAETAKLYNTVFTDTEVDDANSQAQSRGIEAENAFIQSLLLRAGNDDEDVADLISEAEAKLHTLKKSDIEYVANHATSQEMKQWASDTVAEWE